MSVAASVRPVTRGRLLLAVLLLSACSSRVADRAQPSPSATTAPPPVSATSAAPSPTPSPTPYVDRTKVPAGFAPVSFSFVSDRTGWVLGTVPCAGAAGCPALAVTRDGATTFKAAKAPAAGATQIRFAGLSDAWAWSARALQSTHDGAATWSGVALLEGATVVDLATGGGRTWLVTQDAKGLQTLSSTVDDADAFAPVKGLVLPEGQARVVLSGSAVLVPVAAAALEARPALLVSTDGTAFAERELPCDRGDKPLLAAVRPYALRLVCAFQDTADGPQRKTAWASNDLGTTWTQVRSPSPYAVFAVAATTRGTFVADTLGVRVSTDGGRTWRTTIGWPSGSGRDLGMISDALGLVRYGTQLRVTRDGAESWAPLTF